MFTDKVSKILLNAKDDKRIQSIDPIETYPYGTSFSVQKRKN